MSLLFGSSGGGVITLQEPTTASSRTLNLPDATGTVALTSDIPAAGGMTLLGTVATTSGASATLSGLNLTSYKALYMVFNNVSHSNASNSTLQVSSTTTAGSGASIHKGGSSTVVIYMIAWLDLTTGVAGDSNNGGASGITNASTAVSFNWSTSGPFDSGSITVYGVK